MKLRVRLSQRLVLLSKFIHARREKRHLAFELSAGLDKQRVLLLEPCHAGRETRPLAFELNASLDKKRILLLELRQSPPSKSASLLELSVQISVPELEFSRVILSASLSLGQLRVQAKQSRVVFAYATAAALQSNDLDVQPFRFRD